MTTTTENRRIFEVRGITKAVVEGRPYVRYEKGDVELVKRTFEDVLRPTDPIEAKLWSGLAPNQMQVIRDVVSPTGGYLIMRHAPPDMELDDPTPEFRPDPVEVPSYDAERTVDHDHAADFNLYGVSPQDQALRLFAHLRTAHPEVEAEIDELDLDARRDPGGRERGQNGSRSSRGGRA
jgi:hypothetical protein